MICRRDNRIVENFTRAGALRGVSVLAMLAAGIAAAPAAAQPASPGDPECPIVAGVVTCTGNLSDGFRSEDNPTMNVLSFVALTQPIAPPPAVGVIDVRTANNLAFTLDPTVTINATRPFSQFGIATGTFSFGTEIIERPVAAVNLVFDRAAGRTASIANAGTINVSIDPRGSTNYYGGGIVVTGAAEVTLVNTGAINADVLVESGFLFQFQPIRVDFADRISVTNNGRLAFLGEGTNAGSNQILPAVDLRGRAVTFVNNDTITGDGPDFASASIVAVQSALGPASIAFTNAGTINHGNDPQYNDTDGVTDFDPGLLILLGGGSVDFRNTGTIDDMDHSVYGIGTAAGQTQTVRIENGGTIIGGTVEAVIGRLEIGESFEPGPSTYDRFDQVPRTPVDAIEFDLSNSGTLRDSTIVAELRARNSIDIVATNTGTVEGGGFDLLALSNTFEGPVTITGTFNNSVDATNAFFGVQLIGDNTALTFENTGNIGSRADIDFRPGLEARAGTLTFRNSGDLASLLGQGILLEGNSIDAVNSGDLTIDGFNGEFDFPYGIASQQGFSGDRRAFDRTTTLRNDGAITITYNINTPAVDQNGSFATGIAAAGTGDILLTNNGAINVAGRDGTGPVDITGVILDGYWNVTLTNSAPINLDISRNDQVSAALLFFERSIGAQQFQTYLNDGTIRGPYDRDADVNSRIRIMTTANITATGPGAIGIGGVLGLSDVDVSGRDFDGDLEGFVFENDRAAALIDVPAGVGVTGGGGAASAINIQGIGTVTIDNRGSILGRGDASSAAIMIGGELITGLGDEQTADPLPPLPADRFLNLIDMVNAGTLRSNNGYGIRAVEGSITNLVNRGLIFGGVASLRAARTSSILNDGAGTLDGRILLEGAGSSLVNNGIIQVSTPGAVTHLVNGNFSQTAGASLTLRAGDRMNVAGNFALNGDVNLALAAPSLNPVFTVGGNLTLDGRLNVTDAGGFGDGVYRLFDYGGALTDNGLALSALPGGANGTVQTAIANQVNLVVGGAGPGPGPTPNIQFWDGADTVADDAIDGGTATWNNAATNWTRAAGDVNDAWGGNFAVFQATPGTATIDSAGVSASGLQFAVSGYTVSGGPLTLTTPATLRVGDGSAAGAGMTATIASAIAGGAGIDKTDLGTLILTGANGYAGGTRISGGVLQVSADSALGAAPGGVTLDGGTLRAAGAFGSARDFTIGAAGGTLDTGANALTLSGALGGGGAFTKAGTGTLTLSGAGSGYAGTMTLAGGGLSLGGTLGGTLRVDGGTRLSGTGTLNNLDLGGTLATGNSIGTMNAGGNVVIRAGSTIEVEVAAAGGSDRLAAAGSATIEGGTVQVVALDPETQYVDGTRYTFLSAAGGRTGTFTGLTENSAFLDFALGYDATTAFLTVSVTAVFPDVALTFNQSQASAALAAFGQTAGSDSLAVYNAILPLGADAARAAFDASSGEIYPVLVASRLRRGEGLVTRFLARGHARSGEGWGLWASASGHDGRTDADGNGARYSHDGMSGELGVDYAGPGNGWAIGIGGGFDDGDADLRDRASRGEIQGWHLGGYARYGSGGAGFTLGLGGAYASGEADVTRNIAFGTLNRTATARVDLDAWALGAEARYGFAVGGGWALGPAARALYAQADLGAFQETGANSLNLSGGAGNDDGRTRYGGGLFARWQGARGSIDATVTYLGGGGDPTELGLIMAGAPATLYRVRSARGDSDTAAFTLAGALELGGGWSIGANLDAALGSRERNLHGSATIGWRF